MNIRLGGMVAFLLCALPFLAGFDGSACGQDTEKNTIKALFDGVPADLRTKVRNNPVRCDRVNDWLKEQVNEKGKTVDMRVGVQAVYTDRKKDGTYIVQLEFKAPKLNLLGDEWVVSFTNSGSISNSIAFVGVKTADAEKLVDAKQIQMRASVKAVRIPRGNSSFAGPPMISVLLEDVQVDGNKWAPFSEDEPGGSGGTKSKGKKTRTPEDKKRSQ